MQRLRFAGTRTCRYGIQVNFAVRKVSSRTKTLVNKNGQLQDLTLFVSCLPGLEPIVSKELTLLQIPHGAPSEGGGISIRRATPEIIARCNLYLGSASHVLVRCGKAFNVKQGFSELTRKVSRMPWNEWLQEDAVPKVRVTCAKSKLYHTTAVAQRVEAAIEKALNRSSGDGPIVSMTVRILRDVAQISIDTSLSPLHQRGYRLETGKAPLREDIAHAMLLAAGWQMYHQDSARYRGLLDPFCGSGTIAIEGANILAGLPSGRFMDVPALGTPFHDPESWSRLLEQSMESAAKRIRAIQRDHGHPLVLAGDRDEGVVKAARSNADRAGVLEIMDISACSISDQEWFTNKAKAPASFLIATNPPYGKRIVSSRQKRARRVEELLPLYQTLGNKIMDQTRTGNQVGAVVLASNVDLVRRMGVPNTHALFSTDHGGLPVAAMGANLLPDPHPPEVTLVPIAASTD